MSFFTNNSKEHFVKSMDNRFDDTLYKRESHNCYSYFLNKISEDAERNCKENDFKKYNLCRRSQPGYYSGFNFLKEKDYTCDEIMLRTKSDNPGMRENIKKEQSCKPDEYKGAVFVAPGRDYHYYRTDDDGNWTHKPGFKKPTNLDSDGNIITDPEKAAKVYDNGKLKYTDFCGYVCLPRDPKRKNMAYSVDKEKVENNVNKISLMKMRQARTKKIHNYLKRRVSNIISKKRQEKSKTKKRQNKKGTRKQKK